MAVCFVPTGAKSVFLRPGHCGARRSDTTVGNFDRRWRRPWRGRMIFGEVRDVCLTIAQAQVFEFYTLA